MEKEWSDECWISAVFRLWPAERHTQWSGQTVVRDRTRDSAACRNVGIMRHSARTRPSSRASSTAAQRIRSSASSVS